MKSIDKKVGAVTYFKYKINLPKGIVEESRLEDKELKVTFDKGKIIIDKE